MIWGRSLYCQQLIINELDGSPSQLYAYNFHGYINNHFECFNSVQTFPVTCPTETVLDSGNCLCVPTGRSSCPPGFTKINHPIGRCVCMKETIPRCNPGWVRDETCHCNYIGPATCPTGTTISNPATCTGLDVLVTQCPPGAVFYADSTCRCVEYLSPHCYSGLLSEDECTCQGAGVGRRPSCSCDNCQLNRNGCFW